MWKIRRVLPVDSLAMPTYDIFRASGGDPEHDESEHIGIVRADSIVEAVQIANRKIQCRPPAILWAATGDVDDDSDVVRLDELPDRA